MYIYTCIYIYIYIYTSVAVFAQAWSTSGFDSVRLGHAVLLRLLSPGALFGYPGAIFCIRECLHYSTGCAFFYHSFCHAHCL